VKSLVFYMQKFLYVSVVMVGVVKGVWQGYG